MRLSITMLLIRVKDVSFFARERPTPTGDHRHPSVREAAIVAITTTLHLLEALITQARTSLVRPTNLLSDLELVCSRRWETRSPISQPTTVMISRRSTLARPSTTPPPSSTNVIRPRTPCSRGWVKRSDQHQTIDLHHQLISLPGLLTRDELWRGNLAPLALVPSPRGSMLNNTSNKRQLMLEVPPVTPWEKCGPGRRRQQSEEAHMIFCSATPGAARPICSRDLDLVEQTRP